MGSKLPSSLKTITDSKSTNFQLSNDMMVSDILHRVSNSLFSEGGEWSPPLGGDSWGETRSGGGECRVKHPDNRIE